MSQQPTTRTDHPTESASRGGHPSRFARIWTAAFTFLSALLLGWSTHCMLGAGLGALAVAPSPSSWVVRALPPDHPSGQVWLDALFVDGQSVRWKQVEQEGTWTEAPTWTTTTLSHAAEEPASLTFTGSRVLLVFLRSAKGGGARIERDGQSVAELDLRGANSGEPLLWESPTAMAPWWSLPAFVTTALLAAWLLRPWAPGRTGEGWLVFYFTAFHALVWMTQYVGVNVDVFTYFKNARELWKGEPVYFPPAYPALIAVMKQLGPSVPVGASVTIVQHALLLATSVWIHRLLRRCMPAPAAFTTALLAGGPWAAIFLPQALMSENLALFGMIGCVWFGVRASEASGRGTLLTVLSGVLAGSAGLARVVPLAALGPAVLMIHLLPPSRAGFRRAGIALGVACLMLLSPLGWYWIRSGDARFTDSVGEHLFNRVVDSQGKLVDGGPAAKRFIELVGEDPRGKPYWLFREPLKKQGLDRKATEELFRAVAIEGIRDDPEAYVRFTLVAAWRDYVANAVPVIARWGADGWNKIAALEPPPPIPVTRSSLEGRSRLEAAHGFLWPWLCWTALLAVPLLAFLRQRRILLALAWLPAGYLLATASTDFYFERYNVAIVPIVIGVAGVPLGVAFRAAEWLAARRAKARGRAEHVALG